jgi:hypothetical protein
LATFPEQNRWIEKRKAPIPAGEKTIMKDPGSRVFTWSQVSRFLSVHPSPVGPQSINLRGRKYPGRILMRGSMIIK